MKKIILIIWGWMETRCSGEDKPWRTNFNNHELWLANIYDNIEDIAAYIKRISLQNETDILVFLHETPPHNYNRNDLNYLYSRLNTSGKTRIRLFSGGNDPIYFAGNNLYGIVGTNGNLAFEFRADRFSPTISANFILDEEQRTINEAHFGFVWDAYWESPKDNIFEILETFNWRARGFDWSVNSRQDFIKHLAGHDTLWQQLHAFAEEELNNGAEIHPVNREFSMKDFEPNLRHEQKEHIEKTREGIKTLIQKGYFHNENDKDTDTVSVVYDALFRIYKDIAQIDN